MAERLDLSDCIHRNPTALGVARCSCPTSETETIHRCELYSVTCTTIPVHLGDVYHYGGDGETHRICAFCYAEEEGYEKRPSDPI